MLTTRIDWPNQCTSFQHLNENSVHEYLLRKNIITKRERDTIRISEKDLIANRLRLKNVFIDNNMFICPKHRNSFGIGWHDTRSVCHHPEHNPDQRHKPFDCRRANLDLCSKIEEFSVGGRYEKLFIVIFGLQIVPLYI